MKRRLALKRLSASDLTLFESHFRKTTGTKQKAFNMDRSVFVDRLFPALAERGGEPGYRVPVDLSIFGPGLNGLHNVQRKILKQQKNWRLNGELIYDPEDSPSRYDCLKKGDFALFDFSGDVEPRGASLYFIAENNPDDKGLFNIVQEKYTPCFTQHKSMEEVDPSEFLSVLDKADLHENHPLQDLLDEQSLEDAVLGGIDGSRKLRGRRKARGVGKDEFARARSNAEKNGNYGEALLNHYFEKIQAEGQIEAFVWESELNAIAPYDFRIVESGKPVRLVDAKSTSGPFEAAIHVSLGELEEMVQGGIPYDICRLYHVTGTSACMRFAMDVGNRAKKILETFSDLPPEVNVDGVSIRPSYLKFGPEMTITYSGQEDDIPDAGPADLQ